MGQPRRRPTLAAESDAVILREKVLRERGCSSKSSDLSDASDYTRIMTLLACLVLIRSLGQPP